MTFSRYFGKFKISLDTCPVWTFNFGVCYSHKHGMLIVNFSQHVLTIWRRR